MTVENALIGFLAIAILIGLSGGKAKSEEVIVAESIVGGGGLICDNTQEVTDFIELMEKGAQPQEAFGAIAGCGVLQTPMRMRVIALGTYETESKRFLLLRYEFLDAPLPPQYGAHQQALRGTSS